MEEVVPMYGTTLNGVDVGSGVAAGWRGRLPESSEDDDLDGSIIQAGVWEGWWRGGGGVVAGERMQSGRAADRQ